MTRRPRLAGGPAPDGTTAVALLLPGGSIRSAGRPLRIAELGLASLRAALRPWSRGGLTAYLLRYRYRGWYAGPEEGATAADARWALAEIARRHPGARVVLVGNSLGGRAVAAVAGHPAVSDVVGVAPWLPPGESVAPLTGRRLLIVHGSADRSEAPALWSLAYAERARAAGVRTARFIVPGDGHFLLRRQREWSALVAGFVVAAAGLGPMPAAAATAFGESAPLSVPLPAGVTGTG